MKKLRKRKIQHYLKSIYSLNHIKYVENEDIAFIMDKNQDEIKRDIFELINSGYVKNHHKPTLTKKGMEIARKMYRKHELFESFFETILRVSHKEAHKLSDALEHVESEEAEEKIKKILKIRKIVPLSFLKTNQKCKLVQIKGGRGIHRRLNELGIIGNVEIIVKQEASVNGPMKINVRNSNLLIGYNQSKRIFVEVI